METGQIIVIGEKENFISAKFILTSDLKKEEVVKAAALAMLQATRDFFKKYDQGVDYILLLMDKFTILFGNKVTIGYGNNASKQDVELAEAISNEFIKLVDLIGGTGKNATDRTEHARYN